MEITLYTKTLFITLQNKLAMLKDYLRSPIPEFIRDKFSGTAKRLLCNMKRIKRWPNSAVETITQRLENINESLNTTFVFFMKDLKDTPEESLICQKPDIPDDTIIKSALIDYNKKETNHQQSSHEKSEIIKKINSFYKQIKKHLGKIFSYYQEKNSPDELKDASEKLELMSNIMLDMPQLDLSNYEQQAILKTLRKSLKELKSIEKDQIISQNPQIEEINKFDLADYLAKKSRKQNHRAHSNKGLQPLADDQRRENHPDLGQNTEEFSLIINSCEYILNKLTIHHWNQFDIVNLYKNFQEKENFLAEIRQKTSYQTKTPEEKLRDLQIEHLEEKTKNQDIETQLLNENPPFY